jgi:hypothetical protein
VTGGGGEQAKKGGRGIRDRQGGGEGEERESTAGEGGGRGEEPGKKRVKRND